jgi:hypothetical protein
MILCKEITHFKEFIIITGIKIFTTSKLSKQKRGFVGINKYCTLTMLTDYRIIIKCI